MEGFRRLGKLEEGGGVGARTVDHSASLALVHLQSIFRAGSNIEKSHTNMATGFHIFLVTICASYWGMNTLGSVQMVFGTSFCKQCQAEAVQPALCTVTT